jgi:hypothetical protein
MKCVSNIARNIDALCMCTFWNHALLHILTGVLDKKKELSCCVIKIFSLEEVLVVVC